MLEESMADLLINPCSQDEDTDASLVQGRPLQWGSLSLAEALLPLVESPTAPPAPHAPWMCSTRYKTELCSRYADSGSCKYGERCQFAHGLHELRVPSRHPKYKTELCHAFHTVGHCAYGARCLFVHEPEEQRQVRSRRRNIPCRTFHSFGVCPFGTRCNFLHVASDKETAEEGKRARLQPNECQQSVALCRTFSSFGFCLYGTRCRFQHCLSSFAGSPHSSLGGSCGPCRSGTRRALSLASDMLSSTSSSSSSSALPSPVNQEDLSSPFTPPVTPADQLSHNAFTFSSQHLNDLLLPLAWRLEQLESTQAKAAH